jgi:hypothetical protein
LLLYLSGKITLGRNTLVRTFKRRCHTRACARRQRGCDLPQVSVLVSVFRH